jgi:hypothetical protein
MNESHHGHQPDNRTHHSHRPYWKRAHTDWRLWIGVLLMFLAIIYYVMSIDLSTRPRLRPEQPQPAPVGAQ